MSRRESVEAPNPPPPDPLQRIYPSGHVVWVARYYDLDGVAHYAKPDWNDGKSAFKLRWEAQQAIDEVLRELHGAPPGRWTWYER